MIPNDDTEKLELTKELCELWIARLTKQLAAASYFKKPLIWIKRLWWKDVLGDINKLLANSK